MKGYGLFIGVDYCDKNHYGNDKLFFGAKPDAFAFNSLAKKTGLFSEEDRTVITGKDATWAKSKEILLHYAKLSETERGYLFAAFIGHGEELGELITDENDETEKLQFFCFHDRMVLEHEIREVLEQFTENFKVVLVVNACYAGGLVKYEVNDKSIDFHTNRNLANLTNHKHLYKDIIQRYSKNPHLDFNADLLQFSSASEDNEALLGSTEGLSNYTKYFIAAWEAKTFWGDYYTFNEVLKNGLQNGYTPDVWPNKYDAPDFFKRTVPFYYKAEARDVNAVEHLTWSIQLVEETSESVKYRVDRPTPYYSIEVEKTIVYNDISSSPIREYLNNNKLKPDYIAILSIEIVDRQVIYPNWSQDLNWITSSESSVKTGVGIIILYDKLYDRVIGHRLLEKTIINKN